MEKTEKLGLNLPEKGYKDWDVPINENFRILDTVDSLPAQAGQGGKFLKTNGTAASWGDVFSAGNIGDIKYTSRTDIPNGGAWCDGSLYTKAQFPDVYQMLVDGKLQSTTISSFDSSVSANGSCGFFGLDTANERFKVPMLKNVYLKAGQAGEMFGAESLPNIKAGDPSNQNTLSSPGNAATGQYGAAKILGNADDVSRFQIGGLAGILKRAVFDASLSSSTYKDGAKVNPDHVTYRAYIVLYASASEASVAQAAEFMTGLASKANIALDNVASNIDYVVESYKNGENWYRKYKSGWVEQGGVANAGGTVTVTFLKAFKDANYTAVATTLGSHGEIYGQCIAKTSGTVMTFYNYGGSAQFKKSWYACGQGA